MDILDLIFGDAICITPNPPISFQRYVIDAGGEIIDVDYEDISDEVESKSTAMAHLIDPNHELPSPKLFYSDEGFIKSHKTS